MKLNYFNCLLMTLLLTFFVGQESFGQSISVSGTVTDTDGAPLPGVNVVVKGTTIGTVTNLDGKYTINASETDALVFSFIGYLSEEAQVGAQTVIDMTLMEDLIGLTEVVVVGYGTVKKSDVTGSLSSVTAEQIQEMPVTNIKQALQGRAAGVDVANRSYGLNAAPEIRIRGNRSIKAGNDPLYVVDGIPINGTINDINAMDVESVEILKDASATAIYGSRGANGVILITTKRGKSGQFSVNFESSFTFKNPLRFYDELTGAEWMEVARDNQRERGAYTTPYANPDDDYKILNPRNKPIYAWESVAMGYEWENEETRVAKMRATTAEEKELWGVDEVPVYNPNDVRTYDWASHGRNKNALTQNYQFSVSGGSDRLTAYFSLGYVDEDGMGVGENYKRISPRLNMDLEATKWLKIGMTNTFNSEIMDKGHGLLGSTSFQIPITQPYDDEGEFIMLPLGETSKVLNPIRDDLLNAQEERTYRYLGSYYAEISFTKNLKYKFSVSQDLRQWRRGRFNSENASNKYQDVNDASYRQEQYYHYSMDNMITYNKELGVHSIGVTVLQSLEAKREEHSDVWANSLPYETQLWYGLQTSLDPESIGGNSGYSRSQLSSFMGRLNYGLLDKYLVTASLRYDGSSKFYVDNQWDYFPAFAVSWKAHNEEFLKNLSFLTQLKARFGYGTVGQSGTEPYETQGRIAESQYVFGEVPAKGYKPELLQTIEVGWEKTTNTNIGLDFGLYRNRISGSVDLYQANTHDLLLDQQIPDINGYSQIRANVGKVRNEGIEITLNTVNVNRGGFTWETDFTFTKNREQIMELAQGAEDDILNGWFVGYPVSAIFDYTYDGIWQVSDSSRMNTLNSNAGFTSTSPARPYQSGRIRVKDINNDDTININDRSVVGSLVPDFSGGITNRVSYKGFELSAFVFFRYGHSIYSRDGHYFLHSAVNKVPFLVDYYKPMGTEEENADAVMPLPTSDRDAYATSMYYRKASFIRVRHITLSYDVPKSFLAKAKINSLRIALQAFNPLLITDYPFLDPESTNEDRPENIPGGISPKGWTVSLKLGL